MWSSTPHVLLPVVWALPISLATTFGIVIYFLFLWVMRCFSSPGSLHYAMYLRNDTTTLLVVSSLIRISTALCLFAAPRSFSQLVTSFFGAMYQGIHLYALCSLIFDILAMSVFTPIKIHKIQNKRSNFTIRINLHCMIFFCFAFLYFKLLRILIFIF